MRLASSLAAAIEKQLGIAPELVEGHDAIFSVAVNGDLIYNNNSQCGHLPTHEEVLQKISRFQGLGSVRK